MTLAEYLEQTNTTAAAFAAGLDVQRATITRYLNGSRLPIPDMMRAIKRATGDMVEPNDWYTEPATSDEAA